MERQDLIKGCIEYFRSNQWKEFIQLSQERDLDHMHMDVDLSIHPYESFGKLIGGYLKMRGWEFYRPIARLSPKPGWMTLYGVNIRDKAHSDIFTRYNPDVAIAPMPPLLAERGKNLAPWWNHDIKRFIGQFKFRDIGPKEETEVKKYFAEGEQWRKYCELVPDPDIQHVHCNIEGSVHPDVLRKYALENLRSRGWKLAHAIHCYFYAGGIANGKIIFLGLDPGKTYDIAWYYNPDVLIQANTQDSRMVGDEGTCNEYYIMRLSVLENELKKYDWAVLTDDEIKEVLEATKTFDELDHYSWRVVPTQ